ncbi:MAG: DnaJ domain-containing protein [Methanophagales archaeon]|nr:DnaJ domain-containing protein [Methanophagales archaeon]
MAFPYWLCLGYLIYKYFDFRKIFVKKKAFEERAYEKRYEEPYKSEKEARTETVPYYYRVLGVGGTATQEEIKSAYRRLTKIYHPDLSADPDTEKKFKEIKKAYGVLSDPNKRAQYDRFEDSYSE